MLTLNRKLLLSSDTDQFETTEHNCSLEITNMMHSTEQNSTQTIAIVGGGLVGSQFK